MSDLATQYPASPSFESINFKTNTPTQLTNTISGKLRRVGVGTSYYSWEVKYPQLSRLDAGTVKGYLAQALGPQFSFEIVLPKLSYSALPNQTSNVPRVTGGAKAIGSTSISITNCGTNATVLAAGDYFKFNNHTKVYQCVSPCTADGSGNATLYFSGPLVTSVPNSTNLTITAVPFTAILAEEAQEFDVGFGGITSMSVSMREVW
jgi:hypothetical protein